jgi:hypothetical protein
MGTFAPKPNINPTWAMNFLLGIQDAAARYGVNWSDFTIGDAESWSIRYAALDAAKTANEVAAFAKQIARSPHYMLEEGHNILRQLDAEVAALSPADDIATPSAITSLDERIKKLEEKVFGS